MSSGACMFVVPLRPNVWFDRVPSGAASNDDDVLPLL